MPALRPLGLVPAGVFSRCHAGDMALWCHCDAAPLAPSLDGSKGSGMPENQKNELRAEMREHEREVARLSEALARFAATGSGGVNHQELFFAAQLTRHRVRIALIASRLAEPQLAR